MTIVFIGDIHRQWSSVTRGLDARATPPSAAVLLGDMECDRSLDNVAAPLLDRGIPVFWIYGNHDNDGGPEMWANLTDPARNSRTAAGALNGRVVEIAGLRVAGLGGTFRPRIWNPPEPPAYGTAPTYPPISPQWARNGATNIARHWCTHLEPPRSGRRIMINSHHSPLTYW